jgi:hypothetical protein
MEFFYIHKFFKNFFESIIKRCEECNTTIYINYINFKDEYLCSLKCLRMHYEKLQIKKYNFNKLKLLQN